jgi:hypothetical protein
MTTIYHVTYQIPPTRMNKLAVVMAEDEKAAIKKLKDRNPRARVTDIKIMKNQEGFKG